MKNSLKFGWGALALGMLALFGSATLVKNGAAPQPAGRAANAPAAVLAPAGQGPLDPVAMARQLWTPKILPYLEAHAVDIGMLLPALRSDATAAGKRYGKRARGEDAAWNFIARVRGVVVNVNTDALEPTLEIDTDGDGKADLSLQCGPIFHGSALRDALDFVSFGTFDNQISYGQFGVELNDLAAASAIRAACAEATAGRSLMMLAAFTHERAAPLPAVVAVRLAWAAAP